MKQLKDLHFNIMLYRAAVLMIFLFSNILLCAQEMTGLKTGNYSGINGQILNPSSMVHSHLFMDVNIASVHLYADNNYIYIPKEDFSFSDYLQRNPDLPEYGDDALPFLHYWDTESKDVFFDLHTIGPSFMLQHGKHAFGIISGARTMLTAVDIPYHAANFIYEGLDLEEQQGINYIDPSFRFTGMAWTEAGISYAYNFRKYIRNEWSAGISIKGIMAYSTAYIHSRSDDYTVLNDHDIDFRSMDMQLGFSLPVDYYTNDFPDDNAFFKGKGFSLDLGVSFQRNMRDYPEKPFHRLCRQKYHDYVYRIGFSLIDIGIVSFKENTRVYDVEDQSHLWLDIDKTSYTDIDALFREVSARFNRGDSTEAFSGSSTNVFLPSAFSLQFDYHYQKQFYFNTLFIHPLGLGEIHLERQALIAFSPRYEKPHFELQMPLVLLDYHKPRIGLSLRYYFLNIGTDHLGSFLGFSDFTGMDIYIALKFSIRKGNCFKFRKSNACSNFEYW